MLNLLEKVLRIGEAKKLKTLMEKVEAVNALEPEISSLSDDELKAKTPEFKQQIKNRTEEFKEELERLESELNEAVSAEEKRKIKQKLKDVRNQILDPILPEAFAVVREVARRTIGMRHFDVQIMGGVVLHEGKIAEMKTGEGKTLVATLPVYLNALAEKGVHVVTVNDYLAKRDTQWMGPIYHFLGLSAAVIQNDASYLYDPAYSIDNESLKNLRPIERHQAYQADVVYGTNSEFGFDYLRDNMVTHLEERAQRGHHYAIVDEVDSILIDEARTPLIISGPAEKAANIYYSFAQIVPRLKAGQDYDYEVDEKTRTVSVTEKGVSRVEKMLGIDNLYDYVNTQLVNHLNQALRAHTLFKKDVDYVIKDGEVIIVDEFTGRLMVGRRYSEGLHQAIEAKEKVRIREENQTLATITLQNYFRMYEKLAGMTGTAATEADEFYHIYKLETVVIPTHMPMIRKGLPDVIFKTEEVKFSAVVEDIVERHKKGQPVLVGTISIEKSERLSKKLRNRGILHEVLNAKQHEREAQIIAKAGQRGAVTIATNMAGRGTDIILGDGVVEVDGLHILGTERHEARRIDNQLRGRSGRQGDPGSSQFYLSLEDDLMRLFGSERIGRVMTRLGVPDDQPIEHSLITKSIETAQRQVESQNFEIRKHVLEYDDVMNTQRKVIYDERHRILSGDDLHNRALDIISEVVRDAVETFTSKQTHPEEWDLDGLFAYVAQLFPTPFSKAELDLYSLSQEALQEELVSVAEKAYANREQQLGSEVLRELERQVMLQVVDYRWREHLYEMDYLREGIGLRAIGQRDPLVEYQREAHDMFGAMLQTIKEDFVRYIFHLQVVQEEPSRPRLTVVPGGREDRNTSHQSQKRRKIGRNEPCPCGSGKKYKKCCGQ